MSTMIDSKIVDIVKKGIAEIQEVIEDSSYDKVRFSKNIDKMREEHIQNLDTQVEIIQEEVLNLKDALKENFPVHFREYDY